MLPEEVKALRVPTRKPKGDARLSNAVGDKWRRFCMLDAVPPPDDNSRNCCGDEDAGHPDCHLSKRDQPIQRFMYPHVVPNGTPSKSTVRRNHENRRNHQQEPVRCGFTCTARQNASRDNSCDQWQQLNSPPPDWHGSPFWEAWNNHPAIDEFGTPPSGGAKKREGECPGSVCFHRCIVTPVLPSLKPPRLSGAVPID